MLNKQKIKAALAGDGFGKEKLQDSLVSKWAVFTVFVDSDISISNILVFNQQIFYNRSLDIEALIYHSI